MHHHHQVVREEYTVKVPESTVILEDEGEGSPPPGGWGKAAPRPARGPRRAPERGRALKLVTTDNLRRRSGWVVTLREFPGGEREASWAFRGEERTKNEGSAEVEYDELTDEERARYEQERARKDEENRQRAERRARTQVRRLVQAMQGDHLLTLTTRECITERERFHGMLKRFFRAGRRLGIGNHVGVMELQGRGALHGHFAVSGRVDVRAVRRLWWQVCGGKGQGNIHVQGPGPGRAPWKLARYMSKYLVKAPVREAMGQHRYLRSRGITREKVRRLMVRGHHPMAGAYTVRDWIAEAGSVGLVLIREGFGWACSWGTERWIGQERLESGGAQ